MPLGFGKRECQNEQGLRIVRLHGQTLIDILLAIAVPAHNVEQDCRVVIVAELVGLPIHCRFVHSDGLLVERELVIGKTQVRENVSRVFGGGLFYFIE